MSRLLAYGVIAVILTAVVSAAVPACASKSAGTTASTSPQLRPPFTKFDGPPDTPEERYRAILPVLAAELTTEINSPEMRKAYQEAARRAGVTEAEIDEWVWKARSGARVKLLTPAVDLSLRELSRIWAGTWKIESRYARGRLTETQGLQFNEVIRSENDILEFSVLTLESGIAHSFVNAATGDDSAFAMGALVTVTATPGGGIGDDNFPDPPEGPFASLVRGGPRMGSSQQPDPRRRPHLQVQFKGEINGSYGEFRKGVPIEMGMRYQKVGGDYMMVGSIAGPSGVGGIDEYEVSTWGPAQMSTVITNLDLMDTSTRVAQDARPAGMSTKEYWERLRQSNFETLRKGTCKVTELRGCLR